jgi:hypothetical protein
MENNSELNQALLQLKEDLLAQRNQLKDLKGLLKAEIDRDFSVNLWELSEKELDIDMGDKLSLLNDSINPRRDLAEIKSGKKIIGKPITKLKGFIIRVVKHYLDPVYDNHVKFNEKLVNFHLASYIRFRQNEKNIKKIEDKINQISEDLEVIMDDLAGLKK